jgi:hypothetical protein
MTTDRDTRDRVIRCEEKIDAMLPMVKVLYEGHLRRDGGWSLASAAFGVLKHVPAGALGAAILAAVQHLAKVAVVAVLVVAPSPVRAWGTPGDEAYPVVRWQLEVTACKGPVCKERRRDTGSGTTCGPAAEAVQQRKPDGLTVRTTCIETRSAAWAA